MTPLICVMQKAGYLILLECMTVTGILVLYQYSASDLKFKKKIVEKVTVKPIHMPPVLKK
jgi:hypothetical protein